MEDQRLPKDQRTVNAGCSSPLEESSVPSSCPPCMVVPDPRLSLCPAIRVYLHQQCCYGAMAPMTFCMINLQHVSSSAPPMPVDPPPPPSPVETHLIDDVTPKTIRTLASVLIDWQE